MTRYRDLADLRRNIGPDTRILDDAPPTPTSPVYTTPHPAVRRGTAKTPPPYRLTEARTLHTPHTPAPEPAAQSIVLPLPPSGNRYWRHYNGRTVVSDAAKAYRHGVMLQAQAHNLHPFAGPVAVYVRVYRARKAGDLDNFKKVLYDALQGVAYNDDDQIVEEHAWRYDDKDNPRVEVEVRQVRP